MERGARTKLTTAAIGKQVYMTRQTRISDFVGGPFYDKQDLIYLVPMPAKGE